MRIHAALFADAVNGDGRQLDLSGVFPEWWNVPEIPGPAVMPLVVVGALSPADIDAGEAPLVVDALDNDGSHLGRVAEGAVPITRYDWVDGAPMWHRQVLHLQVHVTRVGVITFEVASNEGEPFRVPLVLRLAPA